jgi:DNA-binding XRE family transcriptional regulator
MPRQNTSPADFPPAILAQIEQLAQCMVATRKSRGETQAQWAERLGISQPTMARLERGDASVAMATYVACLWQINPALDLAQLIRPAQSRPEAVPGHPPHVARHFSELKSALDYFG